MAICLIQVLVLCLMVQLCINNNNNKKRSFTCANLSPTTIINIVEMTLLLSSCNLLLLLLLLLLTCSQIVCQQTCSPVDCFSASFCESEEGRFVDSTKQCSDADSTCCPERTVVDDCNQLESCYDCKYLVVQ
jgi:hypothetical protein